VAQGDVQEQAEEEAMIEEQIQEGEAYDGEEVGRTLVDVDRMGMVGKEVEVEVGFPFPRVREEGGDVGRTFVVVQNSFEVA
jgi:hypothetical protein